MESQPLSEVIEIPETEKYILCLLNQQGKPTKYVVFNGNSTPMTEERIKEKLFSKDNSGDFSKLNPQPEFYNSSQQIHKDDTIRTIKKKIIHELGKNEVCYEEIYIFGQQLHEVDPVNILNKEKELFTGKMVSQLAINIQLEDSYYEELIKMEKTAYQYEDLIKYINKSKKYKISIPLGQRFSTYRDLMFSGNPFDVEMQKDDPVPAFQLSKNNELYTFENNLLLNYGEIIDNVIYLCKVGDVLDYAESVEYSYADGSTEEKVVIDQSFMIELYFPLLFKEEILNKDLFLEKQQEFIERNSRLLKPGTFQLYDTVDLFYNIYHSRKSELTYLESGISDFHVIIHPEIDIPLPLDIIFKQIHATKGSGSDNLYYPFIPLIKYNPGKRRESMFRFYSETISKDGKKIPFLSKKVISSISKENKKANQIVIYCRYTTVKKEIIDIYVDINADGNIGLRSTLSKPLALSIIETIIYNVVNPIIIKMNKILEKSGYKVKKFTSINDENIEILTLRHQSTITVDKTINFRKITGCLTSLFDIIDTDLDVNKGILLNFIRVDNYQKMNAISSMITDVFKRTNSQEEIIEALIVNFSFTREAAINEIVNYFNQHQRIHGQYVNKLVDVTDNPGFPISIHKSSFDNKMQIKIDQIYSVQFIDIMNVYIDSIIRMLLFSQEIPSELLEKMKKLCSSVRRIEEEEKIENLIVKNKTTVVQPLVFIEDEDEEEEDRYLPDEDEDEEEEQVIDSTEQEEEEEGYLPEEEDELDEDTKNSGGAKDKGSLKEEKSNIFTKRLKEKEPNLILTKPQGKFVSYSRICPANVNLQPVVLTDEEKNEIDKEHSGAYTNAIKYGSDPKKQFWYICPRYWCLKTNKPMTEDEVKRGDCGGKIIPDNAKPPPPGHFIVEFTDKKYHKDEKGEYVWHSPGFKPSHSHPDAKLCLPCCYSNWASKNKNPSQQQQRRQQCGMIDANIAKVGPDGKKSQISLQTVPAEEEAKEEKVTLVKPPENKEVKKEKERKKQQAKNNIFGIERYPIPQYRWGFLPTSVEWFLHTKNSKYVVKNNPAYIQTGKRPLLRYGVEQSPHQSFIGVLADIYSNYKETKLLSIEEMREKIIELLTLDDYLKLHNGSLTSMFKPSRYRVDDVTVEDFKETEFYNQIDLSNPSQYLFLKDTISSFQNFQNYLRDEDAMIDHTYLWDIISSEESILFDGGLNMVIMEIVQNDITDNIDIICPTNAYSVNIYQKDRGTILILKHDEFYEPIYLYEGKEKENKRTKISEDPIRIFTDLGETEELKTIRRVLNMVMETSGRKCKPINTRPKKYKFKENISASILKKHVEEIGLSIIHQVMNYNGKIIALFVETKDKKTVYLPCFPSKKLVKLETIFMNNVPWSTYPTTIELLRKIKEESNGKILCEPMMKVVEDELLVGLLTETNQFIQLVEPEVNIYEDGLPVFYGVGYRESIVDNSLATSRGEDDIRLSTVRNIKLETQFYISFRTEIRNLLNDYNYREIREEIISVLDNQGLLYIVKMKKLEILIRDLTNNLFTFVDDINNEIKQKIGELANCNKGNCDVKSFCLKRTGKVCFPAKNLINEERDNQAFYFARICDELIRYSRIRLFMLDNKRYLNISNVDYSVNEDEVILLNSVLTDKYFDDLVPFQNNKYVQNITYEVANPSKNTKYYQNFSNKVPLAEQA